MDFNGFEMELAIGGTEQPFRRLLRRARRAFAGKDYETARRILEALARTMPDATSILYPLACAMYHSGDYHEAAALCHRINGLGDTRARLLLERLEEVRMSDAAAWEASAARNAERRASIGLKDGYYGANHPMMRIRVSGPPEDTLALMRVARLHEVHYDFTDRIAPDVAQIYVSDKADRVLAYVERKQGVRISTCQREGICTYTGLDRGAYMLLCALVGTTQWRTLAMNSLLIPEDFHHGAVCKCLFSHQVCREDFALVLEEPEICSNCIAFYRCLGAERDVDSLLGFLNSFRTALSPYDSTFLA